MPAIEPLPACGRLSKERAKTQKERWFKRALRWRAGSERTISHLKHPFSMEQTTYKGDPGSQRCVGWCVITKNLVSIARWLENKKNNELESKKNKEKNKKERRV